MIAQTLSITEANENFKKGQPKISPEQINVIQSFCSRHHKTSTLGTPSPQDRL